MEFLEYICGHTSPLVLRPCPLTINFHTNTVCSNPGCRCVLAMENCPACQRALHEREIQMVAWEHHQLHERGVCGCPAVFPDLLRPGAMSPDHPYPAASWSEAEAGENKTSRHGNGKNKKNGKGETSRDTTYFETCSEVPGHHIGGRPTDHAGTPPKNYPLIQKGPRPASLPKRPAAHNGGMIKETDDEEAPTAKGKNSPSVVAARSPFFQEAECVDENHLLLKSGSCICPRDFSFYQTPEAFQHAWPCFQRSHERAVHRTSFYAPGSQTPKTIYSSAPIHEQDLLNPRHAPPISQVYNNFPTPSFQDPREPNYLGQLDGPETWLQSYSNQYSQAQFNQSWNQYPRFASSDKAYHYWTQADPQVNTYLPWGTCHSHSLY